MWLFRIILASALSSIAFACRGFNCESHNNCTECIRDGGCGWCWDPLYPGKRGRCMAASIASIGSSGDDCREGFLWYPNPKLNVIQNRPVSVSEGEANASNVTVPSRQDVVHISPQRVSLQISNCFFNNKQFILDVAFAENQPLDLYYLMDVTNLTEDFEQTLLNLVKRSAESLPNITGDFRIGFGCFHSEERPAPGDNCTSPYGFRHHTPLTSNASIFSQEELRVSMRGDPHTGEGPLDAPKGIVDAILTYNDVIDWRENAKRVLIYASNARVKVRPFETLNNGTCRWTNQSSPGNTMQDASDISQVVLKVKEDEVNMIFAVTEDNLNVFDEVQLEVAGSSVIDILDDFSTTIETIASTVEVRDTSSPSNLRIIYWTRCLDGLLRETNKCEGLGRGSVVNFTMDFRLVACPLNKEEWKQELKIHPVGSSESLIVDLELMCGCPCEETDHSTYREDSPSCSGMGTEVCGNCRCSPNRFGRKCECEGEDPLRGWGCRPDNRTNHDCSARGTCVCGRCECSKGLNPGEVISGQFCECDNFSCDRNENGDICSGPTHGECVCGQCACRDGWTGPSCACRTGNETCIAPGKRKVCFGKGHCECGHCVCRDGAQGRYCKYSNRTTTASTLYHD